MDSIQTINNFSTFQDKDLKTRDKHHKEARFKPFLDEAPKSENPVLKKRAQRKAKFNKIKEEKEKATEELIAQALAANAFTPVYAGTADVKYAIGVEERIRRRKNRQAYNKRVYKDNNNNDLRDPKNKMNNNWRVLLYARNHNCKCGLKCNLVRKYKGRYEFSCDHETSVKHVHKHSEKCSVCGFLSYTTYKNKICHCSSWLCARCKRQTYIYHDQGSTHTQNYDKHAFGHETITVTINNEDAQYTDFGLFLEKKVIVDPPKEKIDNIVTATSFATMVKAAPGNTRKEARKRWFQMMRAHGKQKDQPQVNLPEIEATIEVIQEIDTTPQAGNIPVREDVTVEGVFIPGAYRGIPMITLSVDIRDMCEHQAILAIYNANVEAEARYGFDTYECPPIDENHIRTHVPAPMPRNRGGVMVWTHTRTNRDIRSDMIVRAVAQAREKNFMIHYKIDCEHCRQFIEQLAGFRNFEEMSDYGSDVETEPEAGYAITPDLFPPFHIDIAKKNNPGAIVEVELSAEREHVENIKKFMEDDFILPDSTDWTLKEWVIFNAFMVRRLYPQEFDTYVRKVREYMLSPEYEYPETPDISDIESDYDYSDFIPTEPEGGTLSAITKPATAAIDAIKEAILKLKDSMSQSMMNAISRIVKFKLFGEASSLLVKTFKAILYFLNVAYDYISIGTPLHAWEFYQAMKNKNYAKIFLIIATEMTVFKDRENLALLQLEKHVVRGEVKNRCDIEAAIGAHNYGILETIIKHQFDICQFHTTGIQFYLRVRDMTWMQKTALDIKHSKTVQQAQSTMNKILSFLRPTPKENKIDPFFAKSLSTMLTKDKEMQETDPEAGFADMISGFCEIFKKFPTAFADGAFILAKLARELLPLLMFTKTAWDIGKIATTITDTFMKLIFGKARDGRTWIQTQVGSKGNPIHELVTVYMSYSHVVAGHKQFNSTDSSNILRQKFYTILPTADQHAIDHGAFAAWVPFKNQLISSFNTPPQAEKREFEPTVLILSGPAGTGKSTIWKALVAHEVVDKNSTDDALTQIEQQTCTWNSASEFQVNMVNRKIILFDDFQQDKTINTEALSLIHLATVAPFAINSPNITGPEIKGCFAEPEIVVACTNQRVEQAAQLIADTDAIRRRYDIDIQLTERYDPNDPEKPIGQILHCNQYKDLIGKMVTLSEARQIFTVVHRAKRARFAKTTEMMKDIVMDKKFLEDMAKVPPTSTLTAGQSKWQLSEDYVRDFNKYVATTPQSDDYCVFTDLGFIGTVFADLLTAGFINAVPLGIALSFLKCIDTLYSNDHSLFSATKLKAVLTDISKCAVAAVLGIAGAFITFGIWFHATREESGTTKTAKATRTETSVPQAGNNSGDFQSLTPLFRNATGTIRRVSDNYGVNCLFIRGNFILTVRHFFLNLTTGKYIDNGTPYKIVKSNWNGNWKEFTFDAANIIPVKGNIQPDGTIAGYREDIIIYALPTKGFTAEKDIIRHFWKGDYSVLNFEVCRHDWLINNIYGEYEPTFEDSVGVVTAERIKTGRVEGEQKTYHILAEATYAGRSSSCGSIVRIAGQTSPILGIHVAAGTNNKKSYFHFVTSTILMNAIKDYEHVVRSDATEVTISQEGPLYMPPNCVLQLEGKLQKPVWGSSKTDLQPSLCYEALGPHQTEPAVLGGGDPRTEYKTPNALYEKLFAGFSKRKGEFTPADLKWAKDTMVEDIRRVQAQSIIAMKELNLDECINGLDIPNNTRMDMTTSCGYPFMGKKKTDLFKIDERDRIIPNDEIIYVDKAYNAKIKNGVTPFCPFILTLKDERVKLAKIKEPRTRIFANGSVSHYLIMRRHFYTMLMTFYHADKGALWCMPSLDRISLDWHEYASFMLEVGDVGFDFDFKNYDRTMSHVLISESVDILLTQANWLTPLSKAALIEFIASPSMIWGNYVFHSNGVNMSGCLLTYILNCTANELIHRAAYKHLAIKNAPLYFSITSYKTNVRGTRGGDDTVTVVSDQISTWYNGVTVSEYLNEKGMEVTSAEKNKPIQALSNFFEMSFLKNKTGLKYGYYIPLCDLDSLIESCYWVRLNRFNNDIVKATQDNCNASLRGIFYHGETTFNNIRSKLLEVAPQLVLSTYEELSEVWRIFFKFPQQHADYPTKAMKQDDYDSNAQPHKIREGLTNEQVENLHTMDTQEIITHYESGPMDKAAINEQMKASVPVTAKQEHYAPENIENASLGDQEKTETARVGTTIQDGAQVSVKVVSTGNTKVDSVNRRGETYLNDVNWDLVRLEKKFTQVGIFHWTTANNVGDILFSANIVNDILKTAAQKAPFDVTQFIHFNQVTMKIVAKMSPMYSGMLLQGFAPLGLSPTIARLVNMGGSIFKCSQDEGVEFTIPFRHWKGFISVPTDDLGLYHVYCMAPLRTGGGNINNIEITVYACIEGLEFKVPDIIPAASYYSRKLDAGQMFVVDTIPEAGIAETGQRSTICNINDPVTQMQSTMLCAGTGLVGKNAVPHFQDGLQDIVTGFKRFRVVANNNLVVDPLKTSQTTYEIRTLYDLASACLRSMFAAYRGSLMLRVTIFPANSANPQSLNGLLGKIWYQSVGGAPPTHEVGNFFGTHYFTYEQPAQIMLPWMNQYFIAPYNVDTYPEMPRLHIDFMNRTDDKIHVTYLIELALADDFHVGIFCGGDKYYFPPEQSLFAAEHTVSDIFWTENFNSIKTTPESGIIQFIDRALQTAVPIVEELSALGVELDAHPVTSQPEPIQIRKMPYGIACDLVNYKETLMTVNHNGMSNPDKECFGVEQHEANIYRLITETKSPVKWLTWDTGLVSGDPIWKTAVGPSFDFDTLHDQIPQSHKYWNGGTRYIFDISATQMHRGQLLFAYSINLPSPAYKDATQTYFTTFDLSAGRGTIAIDCPYLSTKPYLYTPTIGGAIGGLQYSPGELSVFVQNPLRGTDVVDKTVDIVVYKTYLKDFRLGVYAPSSNIPPPSARKKPTKQQVKLSAKKQ